MQLTNFYVCMLLCCRIDYFYRLHFFMELLLYIYDFVVRPLSAYADKLIFSRPVLLNTAKNDKEQQRTENTENDDKERQRTLN